MSIWTGVANKAETGENQSSTSIEEQDEEEKKEKLKSSGGREVVVVFYVKKLSFSLFILCKFRVDAKRMLFCCFYVFSDK